MSGDDAKRRIRRSRRVRVRRGTLLCDEHRGLNRHRDEQPNNGPYHRRERAQLEREMWIALEGGKKIAAVIATLGATDAFGLDDLEQIVK